MPQFDFPFPCRYNTLRLRGCNYDANSPLCAISLVTDLRRPLFADVNMAKSILKSLLSAEILEQISLRAFTLMPNHLHLIARVREPEKKLPTVIGSFKSFTTKQCWMRSREILESGQVVLPSSCVSKSRSKEEHPLIESLMHWNATLRPEALELKNWPRVRPQHFRRKRLWQNGMFDHVVRNDHDLKENLNYIAMNPVRAGYVTVPQFYPYTGMLL